MSRTILSAGLGTMLVFAPVLGSAQSSAAAPPANAVGNANAMVDQGTRFLVRLETKLSTSRDRQGKKFKVKTSEPLVAADGSILPPGAQITGHLSRIEPAAATGRARLWLSFDDVKAPGGKLPIVASVASVPGEHSVRAGDSREGEIEARTSRGREQAEAAATGAAIGAATGAVVKGGKGAAIGAIAGAAAGFLVSSGMGMELELQKGTKLELQLDRPLYIGRR